MCVDFIRIFKNLQHYASYFKEYPHIKNTLIWYIFRYTVQLSESTINIYKLILKKSLILKIPQ